MAEEGDSFTFCGGFDGIIHVVAPATAQAQGHQQGKNVKGGGCGDNGNVVDSIALEAGDSSGDPALGDGVAAAGGLAPATELAGATSALGAGARTSALPAHAGMERKDGQYGTAGEAVVAPRPAERGAWDAGSDTSEGLSTVAGSTTGAAQEGALDDGVDVADFGVKEDEEEELGDSQEAVLDGRDKEAPRGEKVHLGSALASGVGSGVGAAAAALSVDRSAGGEGLLQEDTYEDHGVRRKARLPSAAGSLLGLTARGVSPKEGVVSGDARCVSQASGEVCGVGAMPQGDAPSVGSAEGHCRDKNSKPPGIQERQCQYPENREAARTEEQEDDGEGTRGESAQGRLCKRDWMQHESPPLKEKDDTLAGLRVALVRRGFSKQRLKVFRERGAEFGMDVREWPTAKVCT